MVEKRVSTRVSHAPFQENGPQCPPKVFRDPYMHAHSMRNNKQVLYGDQTKCEEVFTRLTTNPTARSVCGNVFCLFLFVCFLKFCVHVADVIMLKVWHSI